MDFSLSTSGKDWLRLFVFNETSAKIFITRNKISPFCAMYLYRLSSSHSAETHLQQSNSEWFATISMFLALFKNRTWLRRILLTCEKIWGFSQHGPTRCLDHRQIWPTALLPEETRNSCLSSKFQQGCWRLPPVPLQPSHHENNGFRLS